MPALCPALFPCQNPHVFSAWFWRDILWLKKTEILKQPALINIKVSRHILSKSCRKTEKEASQLTLSQKTVINQLYGENKGSVCLNGQKVTGAWRACIRVIFWKGGSDGCQDHPVVTDPEVLAWIKAFDTLWLPLHRTVPWHWDALN